MDPVRPAGRYLFDDSATGLNASGVYLPVACENGVQVSQQGSGHVIFCLDMKHNEAALYL